MAEIKVLKIGLTGLPTEHDSANDDITLNKLTATQLDVTGGIDADFVDKDYTAQVVLAARDVVYISSSGQVSPANASTEATSRVIGLATSVASAASSVKVRSQGVLAGFSSLTPGARYFLSDLTPGAITSTAPSGGNKTIVQVGYAKSATELDIQIQLIAVRF